MSRITCKRKGVKQYQQMQLLFTVFKDSVRKKGELKLLFFQSVQYSVYVHRYES